MRRLLWFVLAVELNPLALPQTAPARTWQVKLAGGSNTQLAVSNNSGVIEFRSSQGLLFTIPTNSIAEITYTAQRVRRSTKAYNRLEDMCCGGTNSHALSLLAMAIAAPLGHAKEHYVEIDWSKKGEGTVVLQLGKDDYLPFLEWLQHESGTKWRDLDQERQRALATIYQRAGAAFPVPLRYPQGDGAASVYTYSVLPLDDRDSTQLFFFFGKVKPKNLVAIAPVTREWSVNTCVFDVKVLYGDCHDARCVGALLLPTFTYRVAKQGLHGAADNAPGAPETPCAQVQREEMEWARGTREHDRPTLKRK